MHSPASQVLKDERKARCQHLGDRCTPRAPPSGHPIDAGRRSVLLGDQLSVVPIAHIAGVDRRKITRWADRSPAHAGGEKNMRAVFQVLERIDTPLFAPGS